MKKNKAIISIFIIFAFAFFLNLQAQKQPTPSPKMTAANEFIQAAKMAGSGEGLRRSYQRRTE